jgi:hypothetical protein
LRHALAGAQLAEEDPPSDVIGHYLADTSKRHPALASGLVDPIATAGSLLAKHVGSFAVLLAVVLRLPLRR